MWEILLSLKLIFLEKNCNILPFENKIFLYKFPFFIYWI